MAHHLTFMQSQAKTLTGSPGAIMPLVVAGLSPTPEEYRIEPRSTDSVVGKGGEASAR